jgi:hypothetical protein
MHPAQQAANVYEHEPCERTFAEDVEAHLLCGYVISRPDLFVLFRAVDSRADPSDIVNPWVTFDLENCDCWMIYLAAGDMQSIADVLPHELPLVGYERNNVLFFRSSEKIIRLAKIFQKKD